MKFKEGITEKHVIVKCGADTFFPFALVLGIYIILFGTVSPGGGFQGGVTVASGVLLLYLGYGYKTTHDTTHPHLLQIGESIGATIYLLLGASGILMGFNFCRNWLFNNGAPGELISGGTIGFMGFSVGFKVLTGVSVLLILMIGMLGAGNADDDDEEAELTECKACELTTDKPLDADSASANELSDTANATQNTEMKEVNA